MSEEEIKNQRSKKAMYTGLLIVGAGVIWLLSRVGIDIPYWVFSWQMLLIGIGVLSGINKGFKNPPSWILITIGTVFLISDVFYIPLSIRDLFWPLLVIVIGLIILIRPRTAKKISDSTSSFMDDEGDIGEGDVLDIVSIFTGTKRNIFSKSFRGGETVTVFGGTELNLLQADFDKPIKLESVVVFGGLKLIVPPNWDVRVEATPIFGGIDDKRSSSIQVLPENKVVVLTGIVLFGGIDIVSY